jgi:hypothetical protein
VLTVEVLSAYRRESLMRAVREEESYKANLNYWNLMKRKVEF